MRQPRLRLRQARPFRGARRKRRELGAAAGRAGRVRPGSPRRPARRDRALESVLPRPPGERDFARQRRKTAVGIEQLALSLRAAERLMRVLPVQIDQSSPMASSWASVAGRAVDVRAASALRIEHAAQQERPVALREIVFDEPGARAAGASSRSNSAAISARSAPSRSWRASKRSPSSERQRVEQQRFAGAGLAGQHGEATVELDLECLDDGEVSDG